MTKNMKLATKNDLMTCGYCKKKFERGESVFIKPIGFKSMVIFCDDCRKESDGKGSMK